MINTVTTNATSNVVVVTAPGPSGPIGPQGPTGEPGTIESNSGTIITPRLVVSGSAVITGSLIVSGSNTFINIGPALFTGSTGMLGNLTVNGTSSATVFSGSGAGLTNIPAAGITGLNLSRIASGVVSASVATGGTAFTLNTGGTNLFTVSNTGLGTFAGSLTAAGAGTFGTGLTVNGSTTNINQGLVVANGATLNGGTTIGTSLSVNGTATVSNLTVNAGGVTTLNGTATLNGAPILTSATVSTNRITDSNISASVSATGKAFSVNNGATELASVDQQGSISGSGLNIVSDTQDTVIDTPNITLVGNATLNGQPITTAGDLTLNQIKSGAVTASVSTGVNAFILEDAGTTLLTVSNSGITSGSFEGSGAGLANIPASGIVGLNLSRTSTGSISASVDIGSDSFILTSASAALFKISNTGVLSGSGANLYDIPASGIVGLNLSRTATGSVTASVNIGATPFTIKSGSFNLVSVTSAGRIAVSKSINVGVPTSNQWQESLDGSYFNTFNNTSDVSEVLRFVAGLLSASAPSPTPNTKIYNSIQENKSGTNTSTIIAGYVPQSSTDTNIIYLTGQNFAAAGTTLFPGKTLYSNSAYAINYSSVAGGSTSVSSSADAQLFGLGSLTSGGPTQFNVSGTVNWFYSDNNAKTSTATSQSENLLTTSTFGTTNGLTLAKINTVNPAVIPAAFQDSKFANIYTSQLYNGGRSFSNISSSGWYQITASIAIASGSSPYSSLKSATEEIFWAPVSTINTAIGNNTPTFTGAGTVAQTATSRSLSGAPYLQTATWTISSSVSGIFNPLYAASSTLADFNKTDSSITLTGITAVSTAGGTIQTSNTVFDFTGTTARSVASIPFETDIIKLTGSATFNAGTSENINQTGLETTNYNLSTRARNNAGSQSTLNTQIIDYISDGTFGQPSASGSMGYYGRAQGYDPGTLTGGSETFFGEDYRMQITDNLLVGTQAGGDSWDTSYGTDNLGDLDLQIKPGFLVKPGGTYGYWLPDRSSEAFRFYARAFQRSTSGAAASITLTITTAATAVNWQATGSDGLGIAVLMQSVGTGVLGTARLLDPTDTLSNVIATGITNNNSTNPFTPNIDLYGNSGGSFTDGGSTLTAVIPVRNADGFFLDVTYPNLVVLLRYKGDISPVTNISISYS